MSVPSAEASDPGLGSRLRAARLARGWTQADVAERLGVVTASVGRWERDEVVPQRHLRTKLGELLGLELASLVAEGRSDGTVVDFPTQPGTAGSAAQLDPAVHAVAELLEAGLVSGQAASKTWWAAMRALARLRGVDLQG